MQQTTSTTAQPLPKTTVQGSQDQFQCLPFSLPPPVSSLYGKMKKKPSLVAMISMAVVGALIVIVVIAKLATGKANKSPVTTDNSQLRSMSYQDKSRFPMAEEPVAGTSTNSVAVAPRSAREGDKCPICGTKEKCEYEVQRCLHKSKKETKNEVRITTTTTTKVKSTQIAPKHGSKAGSSKHKASVSQVFVHKAPKSGEKRRDSGCDKCGRPHCDGGITCIYGTTPDFM